MKTLLLALIRLYQLCLSPFLGAGCRFTPTCSHFATEALEKHGMLKGSVMTVRRVCSCHPWGKPGYDPVPDKIV